MSEDSGAAFSPLDRHRLRRSSGIPTVTVLVGEPDAAEWVWESWQRSLGRANVSAVGTTETELMRAWLANDCVRNRIAERIKALVAEHLGLNVVECGARIAGQGSWQFADLVTSLVPVLGCTARQIHDAFEARTISPPASEVEVHAANFAWASEALGSHAPALLLRDAANSPTKLEWLARASVRIAAAAPHVDLGIVVGSSYSFADSRELALLREGVVQVGSDSPKLTAGASTSTETVLSYDRAEFARSRAERALYSQLESRPTTRGLFILNGKLEERFGSGALEVDLLSEKLSVALEVDGYHHFRDSTAYRRDRKKDLLLQELGYLVIRVLASDIDDEFEHVLELIDRAVARRSERTA